MSPPTTLTVWLHDEPIGAVARGRRGDVRLTYSPEVLDRHSGNVPLLSCSLLTATARLDATGFIDGLLPQGEHRRALAARAKLAAHDTFGLIARYGRDIAGAVQFTDQDNEPRHRDRWQL
ncbi:HipA N-terminal domain-containing protein [Desertimonas flava]|uniref:HipA N-terminal domain-containing protein n=1 Tax=Desertimonas flava TaxID=2064846 RepID=UPI000E344666|nr:HipA N-terminal domain-containing protein [Desertimonas flava]